MYDCDNDSGYDNDHDYDDNYCHNDSDYGYDLMIRIMISICCNDKDYDNVSRNCTSQKCTI